MRYLIIIACLLFSCKPKVEEQPIGQTAPNCSKYSACGCSAKDKLACELDTNCCKWITGQGCGCK
jgi:hypothetical protein